MMETVPVEVFCYQTSSGRCPFRDWLESLDRRIRLVVDARLARVRRGLFGRDKNLGGGIWELKFDIGPGYRIYYGRVGAAVVLLLHAGQKHGQSSDIDSARAYWADYLKRTRE